MGCACRFTPRVFDEEFRYVEHHQTPYGFMARFACEMAEELDDE